MTENMVYLRYHTLGGKVFQVGSTAYVPITKNQISILVCVPEHAGFLLSQRCGCCGNERPCFRVATPEEVAVWNK